MCFLTEKKANIFIVMFLKPHFLLSEIILFFLSEHLVGVVHRGRGLFGQFSKRFVALRERLLFEEISSQGKNECVF